MAASAAVMNYFFYLCFYFGIGCGLAVNLFQLPVQFPGFGFLLLFIMINPFLDTLGNQPGLLLGLPWPLGSPGRFHGLFFCLG